MANALVKPRLCTMGVALDISGYTVQPHPHPIGLLSYQRPTHPVEYKKLHSALLGFYGKISQLAFR